MGFGLQVATGGVRGLLADDPVSEDVVVGRGVLPIETAAVLSNDDAASYKAAGTLSFSSIAFLLQNSRPGLLGRPLLLAL